MPDLRPERFFPLPLPDPLLSSEIFPRLDLFLTFALVLWTCRKSQHEVRIGFTWRAPNKKFSAFFLLVVMRFSFCGLASSSSLTSSTAVNEPRQFSTFRSGTRP